MPINALRNLTESEIDVFLGNGVLVGLGPEKCLVAWGKPKKSKSPVRDQLCFYIPDFYLEEKSPWIVFENATQVNIQEFANALEPFTLHPTLDLNFKEPSRDEFAATFDKIQQEIQNQNFKKVVPVTFAMARGALTKAMRARFVKSILVNANKQTPYLYFSPTDGVIGATPETLFTYDMRTHALTTMALAGTRRSDLEKKASLINDVKEMYEHELVIKGLKEKISNLGDMHVSPTYVWDLGPISHLRTDISVDLSKELSPEALFIKMCALLHPTAALGVAPNSADWKKLKEFDMQNERGRFGAPFGVLSPTGKSIVLVAIRNLQFNEEGLVRVGSGCGIVGASVFENEWQELALKRKTIFNVLGIQ